MRLWIHSIPNVNHLVVAMSETPYLRKKSNGLEYWGDNLVFGRLSAARDMLLLPVSNLCLLTVHTAQC